MRIYEDSKDVHVAATVIFDNADNKAYTDAACTVQFGTADLEEAYLKGAVIKLKAGGYVTPVAYSESSNVGSISYQSGSSAVALAAIRRPLAPLTLSAENGSTLLFEVPVSDLQRHVSVNGDQVEGTLKYLAGPNAITEVWGAGNFFGFKISAEDWSAYTSVKVGLEPSEGSGLVEIIDDPDKNGTAKITNKNAQKFVIESTDGVLTQRQVFDLSHLNVLYS